MEGQRGWSREGQGEWVREGKGKMEGWRGQMEKEGTEEEVEGGLKWEGRKEWQRPGEQS